MPRRKLIRTSEFPYHITSRSNNREWFYVPIEDVWKYCLELLDAGAKKYGIETRAFVLMNNHYHLCLYTPKANIDAFMRFFNKSLGSRISRQAGRINRIFGASYKWTVITNEAYLSNVIRYVYQNPLRADLCERCEDYPFSDLLMRNPEAELLNWLNRHQCQYDTQKTRKNLKKYEI